MKMLTGVHAEEIVDFNNGINETGIDRNHARADMKLNHNGMADGVQLINLQLVPRISRSIPGL